MAMTRMQANQAANDHNFRLTRPVGGDEYRVVLNEWDRKQALAGEYFTNDLEDAVLTGMAMRRHASQARTV